MQAGRQICAGCARLDDTSKLQFFNGKLLIRNGKLAMNPNCCCGSIDCVSVSEVVPSPSNRAIFSFPMDRTVVSADAGVFAISGATGVLVLISGNNVQIEFADEVRPGDPWTITDGSQIHFDGGAVACDNQNGSVL